MNWWHALILGAVEGLTEFLPVSSTGHLVLMGAHLGADNALGKVLDIVIQLGAVLAVVLYYRERLGQLLVGVARRERRHLQLARALLLAFLPAAVTGLLFHRAIKARLFGPLPVAGALIAGGLLMLGVERWRRRSSAPSPAAGLENITPGRAAIIGLAQCFSLWPGMSRSMTSIVGGQLCGLDTTTAAEFSFLLSIPTLGAATLYDLAKHGRLIAEAPGGLLALGVGLCTAFLVALAVIAVFLRMLTRLGLAPFGLYRIALGLLVLWASWPS